MPPDVKTSQYVKAEVNEIVLLDLALKGWTVRGVCIPKQPLILLECLAYSVFIYIEPL